MNHKIFGLLALILLANCSSTNGEIDSNTSNADFSNLVNEAEKGDPQVQYALGNAYFTGENTEVNKEKATEWFFKSAEQDYDNAEYTLGYLYETGDTLSKDDVKSAQWYLKAALQGHEESQYKIGEYYSKGIGVSKDIVKAIGFLKLTSDLDTRSAQLLESIIKDITNQEKIDAQKYYEYLYKTTTPLRKKNESSN